MAHNTTRAGSRTQCPFIELPGELRNIIFAYALHQPEGLRFRRDDYGIGRLVSNSVAAPSSSKYFATCKTEAMTRKEMIQAASGAANQLQYVNHELRRETRGLGIRYNDLSFDHLRDISLFVTICPALETQYLRNLRLLKCLYTTKEGLNAGLLLTNADISRLFSFCERSPTLVLENYIQGWSQTQMMFVPYALLVEMQFRKTSKRVADFFTEPRFQDQIRDATATKVQSAEQPLPANFKLFPEDKIFDEQAFRKAVPDLADLFGTGIFERVVEGGIDGWVPLVRKIYDEGI